LFAQGSRSEKILFNGKVVTSNAKTPVAEAVSIAGDKIVAVGTLESVRGTVGDRA